VRDYAAFMHTLACNLVHCVFSTKNREGLIPEPERLRQYLAGIARTWTFEQEFLTLLRKSKMDFDPRYVFDGVPCPGHSES